MYEFYIFSHSNCFISFLNDNKIEDIKVKKIINTTINFINKVIFFLNGYLSHVTKIRECSSISVLAGDDTVKMNTYLLNPIGDTSTNPCKLGSNEVTSRSNILKLSVSNLIVDFTTLTKTFSNKLAGKDFSIRSIIHISHEC